MNFLVTGGAGFIGSHLVKCLVSKPNFNVLNFDKLTYASNLAYLTDLKDSDNYDFFQGDLASPEDVERAIKLAQPNVIVNLAAESHVDRSIKRSDQFIQTNIVGTYNLLEAFRAHIEANQGQEKEPCWLLHVSTDEVFGDLAADEEPFTEESVYRPSSPYSASKAASDHLVRAWMRTYGLPAIITNCSNNYGPHQYSEKLIPNIIISALSGKKLPVYGDGEQIRDWLFVEDHIAALMSVIEKGKLGHSYNIGANNEIKNIDIVLKICRLLDDLVPNKPNGLKNHKDLIRFVDDRPGHDRRYAINSYKIRETLLWAPKKPFELGLQETVLWYLEQYKSWS
jgi:dTDP-glucose 4,6-dehydratase